MGDFKSEREFEQYYSRLKQQVARIAQKQLTSLQQRMSQKAAINCNDPKVLNILKGSGEQRNFLTYMSITRTAEHGYDSDRSFEELKTVKNQVYENKPFSEEESIIKPVKVVSKDITSTSTVSDQKIGPTSQEKSDSINLEDKEKELRERLLKELKDEKQHEEADLEQKLRAELKNELLAVTEVKRNAEREKQMREGR